MIKQTQVTSPIEELTSHPHPEPWIEAVVVLNSFLRFSRLPKDWSMASLRGPAASLPPFPFPSEAAGARLFQKSEWLMCPDQSDKTNCTLVKPGECETNHHR